MLIYLRQALFNPEKKLAEAFILAGHGLKSGEVKISPR